ncbi:S-layer homology domain-containing protein [Lysinibacillus sp. LZ02]|uniref:S-layer homology domain-containing protein n=1 Tax=Lysinibacillus sp. LZ02 TaxID=3420668 RepID=UPI003D36399F
MHNQKRYKLTASAILAVGTIVSVAPGISQADSMFRDVDTSDSYYKDLVNLVNQGVISGFADKSFNPSLAVTRGHFAQMLVTVLDLDMSEVYNPNYSDVSPSSPFYKAIAALANSGVNLAKADGTFRPNDSITRYEAANILNDILNLKASSSSIKYTDVNTINSMAVKAVVQNGIMQGKTSTSFGGNSAVTRADVVSILASVQAYTQSEVTFTFEELKSSKAYTSEGTYSISEEMEAIFKRTNVTALANAKIKAVVVNGQIVKISSIEFTASGRGNSQLTFDAGGTSFTGDIIVNANYLTIKNAIIEGDLTLTDDAKNGFAIEKVTVKKSMVIEDGDSTTFTFASKSSSIKQLYIDRDYVVINADREITEIILEKNIDDVAINSKVKKLTIAGKVSPIVSGYATIGEIVVERGADVNLRVNGTANKITIEHIDSTVTLNKNLLVSLITIPRGTYYADVISNYSAVVGYVTKIQQEGSTSNLLGYGKIPIIPDGSWNDPNIPGENGQGNGSLTFEKALDYVTDDFTITPTGKKISVKTVFNNLNTAIKNAIGRAELTYKISTTSELMQDYYVIEVEYASKTVEKHISKEELKEGITLEQLLGESLGLVTMYSGQTETWTLDVKSLNGEIEWDISIIAGDVEFLTESASISGSDTGPGEGPGEGPDEGLPDIADMIEDYTVSTDANILSVATTFKTMSDEFLTKHASSDYDYLLKAKASTIDTSKNYEIVVKKDDTIYTTASVSGSRLSTGVYLSALNYETYLALIKDMSGKSTNWTVEFKELDTKIELDISLIANRKVVRTISESVAGTFEYALQKAIDTMDVVTEQNKIIANLTYGTFYKNLLGDAQLDAVLKVTSGYDYLPNTVNITFVKNGKVNYQLSVPKADLIDGLSLKNNLQMAKLSNITSEEDTWEIIFSDLHQELSAEFQFRVTRTNDQNVTITENLGEPFKDLTVSKSEYQQIKEFGRSAVKHFVTVGETLNADGTIIGDPGTLTNTLYFKTIFSELAQDDETEAKVNYKFTIDETYYKSEIDNNKIYSLIIKHNNEEQMTGFTVTGEQLNKGVTLREILGNESYLLPNYSDMKVNTVEGEDGSIYIDPTDEWSITFVGLNSAVRINTEVLINEISLHDENIDGLEGLKAPYLKKVKLNNTPDAAKVTEIEHALKHFETTANGNKVKLKVNLGEIGESAKEAELNFVMFEGSDTFRALSSRGYYKNVKMTLRKDGKEIASYSPLVHSILNSTEGTKLFSGSVAPIKLGDLVGVDLLEYELEFDNIISAQNFKFTLQADGREYFSHNATINEGNTAPIFSELDLAIKDFTASTTSSDSANILTVSTTYNQENVTETIGGQAVTTTLVKKEEFTKANAKVDAILKLDPAFAAAPDDYEIDDLKIEINGHVLNAKSVKIAQLKTGVHLSDLLDREPATLVNEILDSSRTDEWIISSDKFKFDAKATVSLVVDVTDKNIKNSPIVVKEIPLQFYDVNTWDNYEEAITASAEANKLTLLFNHELPREFIEADEDAESVWKLLFTDTSFGSTTADSINFDKVKVTSGKDKNNQGTITIELLDGAINHEATGALGYVLANFEPRKTIKWEKIGGADVSSTTDDTVYILFEKNALVDHDEKVETDKVQGYSAQFVTAEKNTQINAYQEAFEGFEVVFGNNEVYLTTLDAASIEKMLTITTEFGGSTTATKVIENQLLDVKITFNNVGQITEKFKVKVYYDGELQNVKEEPHIITVSSTDNKLFLSEILREITAKDEDEEIRSALGKKLEDELGEEDKWEFVIETSNQKTYSTTIELILVDNKEEHLVKLEEIEMKFK